MSCFILLLKDKCFLRHFHIDYNLKGIDKKMKKIIKANKLPNLSKYNNFPYFLGNNHQLFQSDTEQSDLEELEFENKQHKKQQMSVRLHEYKFDLCHSQKLYFLKRNQNKKQNFQLQ